MPNTGYLIPDAEFYIFYCLIEQADSGMGPSGYDGRERYIDPESDIWDPASIS